MSVKNIWGNDNQEGFFRKKIVLQHRVNEAYLRIYVDTGYELFINGRFVAAVDEWCNTRDYRVQMFLKEGVNVIAVHGINHGGHRGFALELVTDGETVLTTDGNWKVNTKEVWGWLEESFDDAAWENAKELNLWAAGSDQWWTKPGSDPERIVPTLDCSLFFRGSIPKTCNSPFWKKKSESYELKKDVIDIAGKGYEEFSKREHLPEVCNPESIVECTGIQMEEAVVIEKTQRYTGPQFILDFGREVVGFFRMILESETSVSFRLHYGETLEEARREPSRDSCLNHMLCDEYRLFGGIQEFESRMKVGFRYVRVEFFDCESSVRARGFSVKTSYYPVKRKGYFSCEDEQMNQLWEMGERTLHYCMQEYYVDAPKRDRFLWTGDARQEAMLNYYTFGDVELFKFCWEELEKFQRPDGSISSSYGEGCSNLWDYVAWYVIGLYEYYQYSGDREFVKEHLTSAEKAVDYLCSLCGKDGLIHVPKNPMGNLWMVELNEFVGVDPYLNWIYYRSLLAVAALEKVQNNSDKEQKYYGCAELIREQIEELSELDNMRKNFGKTTHSQIQYELAVLESENHQTQEAVERMRTYWASVMESGADCTFEASRTKEQFSKITEPQEEMPPYYSYCHAWTGGATALLPMLVAGIKPVKAGFEKVRICPELNIFKTFVCVVPTPMGEVCVKWENEIFSWYVPDKIEAEICINEHIYCENKGVICCGNYQI